MPNLSSRIAAALILLAPLPLQAQHAPHVSAAPIVRIAPDATHALDAQETRSRWVEGAVAGFVVGSAATWVWLHTGGSTSLCDRDRNQDAIRPGECLAIAAGGGVVGALIGGFVGSRIRTSLARSPVDDLRFGFMPRSGVDVRLRFDVGNGQR
jgi:hypothetical protein